MANLPVNVGEALWIGAAAGKNHFNIGIGGTGGGTDHTDYPQSSIEDGDSPPVDATYFHLDSNGDVVFKQFVENGRTTTNTKYSRTELRELQTNGTALADWSGSSGTHYMQGRTKIDHVPSAKPWVCFFQVHDAKSDLARVQTEDGAIVCRRTPPGGTEIRTVIKTSYTIGAWYAWEMRIESGTFTVKLDGVTVLTATGMGESGCYFKTGCYNQVSNTADGGGASAGEYCQVTMQRGSLVTWHSGYPTPTTPVFTGGTDSNGGPGNTGGVDTEPPSSPTGLTVTRVATGNQLTWNAATDNVGVHHYNVYRSGGTGSPGTGETGGTLTTVGNTDGGAATTSSSADKIAASRFVAGGSGTLTAGHWRAWLSASGSTTAKLAVYADSSGSPGALLATSDALTITATAESVRDFVFSGGAQIAMAASSAYWLAATWDDPGTPSIIYSRDELSSQRLERSDITYGTPPNPFGTPTGTFAGPIDIWVDLNGSTSGGGTTTAATIRSSNTAAKSSTSSGSISVTKPTGLAAGDYLLGISVGDADITLSSMTAPSGWSTLSSQAGSPSDNYPPVKIFGKVADSTDAAASSFSFGFTSTGDGATILAAITTGTYNTTTPAAMGTYTTQPRTSTTTQTAPSMTGVANGLLIDVFGTDTNNTTESYPTSGPAGFTRLATAQGTPHYAMAGAYYKTLTAAGATGTASVSPTGAGTTNGWTTTAVMINPKVS